MNVDILSTTHLQILKTYLETTTILVTTTSGKVSNIVSHKLYCYSTADIAVTVLSSES